MNVRASIKLGIRNIPDHPGTSNNYNNYEFSSPVHNDVEGIVNGFSCWFKR